MFKPDDVNKEFTVLTSDTHCFKVGQLVQLSTYMGKKHALFTDLTGCITQMLDTKDVKRRTI